MKLPLSLFLLLAICLPATVCAQDSTFSKLANLPGHFLSKLNAKTNNLSKQLNRQAEDYAKKMTAYEARLKTQLSKVDSNATKNLNLSDPQQQYARYLQRVKTDTTYHAHFTSGQYQPYVDSMRATLAFLNKNPQLLSSSGVSQADLQQSMQNLQLLQSKMQNADLLKQYITQRKDLIKQYFSQMTHLPPGITGLYGQYNQQLYYYTQQLQAYKDQLNDPDKMMKTALALVEKLPAFTDFMKKNSMLAGLFGTPDGYNMSTALAGMQTKDQVNGMVGSQVSAGGPGATQALSQGMQSAQGALNQLKQRMATLGSGGDNTDLPTGFKPNNQKTKTFFQRLEFGANLQTTPSNYFFPATSDFGLSIGYKLSNKSTVGIGGSYKMGWELPVSHLHLSNQGASLRSFFEVQVKSGFSATGGFEYNYQQPNPDILQVPGTPLWTRSGLIGVSKTLSMHSKYFKTTKVQLLWDFLSYSQVPQTQALKFRVAYTF